MASYNNFLNEFGGFIMLHGSAAAETNASVMTRTFTTPAAFAKAIKPMKLPPGACAVEKKAVNTGTICSFQCNAQTNWCAQQFCNNGTLVQVLPCFGPFCAAKCAG